MKRRIAKFPDNVMQMVIRRLARGMNYREVARNLLRLYPWLMPEEMNAAEFVDIVSDRVRRIANSPRWRNVIEECKNGRFELSFEEDLREALLLLE